MLQTYKHVTQLEDETPMVKDDVVSYACEEIDKVISLDVSMRGLIKPLYEHAVKIGDSPLVLNAAEKIKSNISEGDVVIIASGCVLSPTFLKVGEMDGPPGATALARAVGSGLGAIPIVMQESSEVSRQRWMMNAVGFSVTTLEDAQKVVKMGRAPNRERGRLMAVTSDFPDNDDSAKKESRNIISEINPAAIICVERKDKNRKGIYHDGAGGYDASEGTSRFDFLIEEAKKKGILTIGIGDYGNEIGFGIMKEVVEKHIPWGAKCRCPCESGIASVTRTDILLPATVSNWGAYGISAALGLILKNKNVIHSGRMENLYINAAHNAGFLDPYGVPPSVDYLPLEIHVNIAELTRTIAEMTLKKIS